MGESVFLGICGSLRHASRNMGLLRCAKNCMPANARLEIADISAIPFYNQDLEKPESVKKLIDKAMDCDGFVFACPEYNYSLAPALKNALDWLSREPNLAPLYGKPAAIMGAGGGMGTCRAQNHLRQICVYLNLLPINKPELFSNAFSDEFDEDGSVKSDGLHKRVEDLMTALAEWNKALKKGRQ